MPAVRPPPARLRQPDRRLHEHGRLPSTPEVAEGGALVVECLGDHLVEVEAFRERERPVGDLDGSLRRVVAEEGPRQVRQESGLHPVQAGLGQLGEGGLEHLDRRSDLC